MTTGVTTRLRAQRQAGMAMQQVPSSFMAAGAPSFRNTGFNNDGQPNDPTQRLTDYTQLGQMMGALSSFAALQGAPETFKVNPAWRESLSQRVDSMLAMPNTWMGNFGEVTDMDWVNMSADGVFVKPRTGDSGLPGSRGAGMKGLQQGFSDRLQALFSAANKAGHTASIGNGVSAGWRSYARQVELRKGREGSRMVAVPGRSNHGWGLAADLAFGSSSARNWIHSHAAQYGLRFPMSYENWHIEPMRIVASGIAGPSAGYGQTSIGPAPSRPTNRPRTQSTPSTYTPAPKPPSRQVIR